MPFLGNVSETAAVAVPDWPFEQREVERPQSPNVRTWGAEPRAHAKNERTLTVKREGGKAYGVLTRPVGSHPEESHKERNKSKGMAVNFTYSHSYRYIFRTLLFSLVVVQCIVLCSSSTTAAPVM